MIYIAPSLSDLDFIPALPLPRFETIDEDISYLENAFLSRNFGEIIDKPKLFWLAFCKAFSQIDVGDDNSFATSLKGNRLEISGQEAVILGIQNCVEEIRKLFVKGIIEKTSFTIVPVSYTTDILIKENAEIIDVTDFDGGTQQGCLKSWFKNFVEPTMHSLCKSIGATCLKVSLPIREKWDNAYPVEHKIIKAFKIDWVSGDDFVYPIKAKIIPSRDNLKNSMYSMYENEISCDLSLFAKDGVVRVHSVPLYTYGGEIIQKILTFNMKKYVEKVVHFKEFSLKSVKAFVDFMYLGEDGLEPESVLKRKVDLCELFKMAHKYQVQALIDCCTNLFSLSSSIKDIEKIKYLDKKYNNEHLKMLHEHLLLKLDPSQTNFIKV